MCVLPRCVLGAHGGQERILIPGPGVADGSELPGQYSEANPSPPEEQQILLDTTYFSSLQLSALTFLTYWFPDLDKPGQIYVPFKEELSVVKYSQHLDQ